MSTQTQEQSTTTSETPKAWPVYRVIRFYRAENRKARTIKSGLTLAEAQAHCGDPATRQAGVSFDGYDYIRGFKPRHQD